MPARTPAQPFPVVGWFERRTRRQRRLALVVAALAVGVLLVRVAAVATLDRWWYASVTDADVWATRVGAQALLAVVAGLVSGVVLVGSAWLAHRTPPAEGNQPNRLVLRYRERMGGAHTWLLLGFAAWLSLGIAVAATSHWDDWLLFLHGPTLGTTAPDVGFDLGFHLFRLPLLVRVSSWLRELVVVAAALAVAGYLATGALKLPRAGRASHPRVWVHLVSLAAGFAGLQAIDYVLVTRPANATNRTGAFDGPGWTIVHVVLPALLVLAAVAGGCALVAAWSARTRRGRPVAVAFGAWAVLQLLLVVALPALLQQVVVAPAEAARELPHIQRNLDATRTAYGLDRVEQVSEPFTDGVTTAPADTDDLARVPLFATTQLARPLQVLVGTTGTRIQDVDLDRYAIDGVERPVLLATRNVTAADLPERGWVQEHLVYTHGDGVVAVPADAPAPDGRPDVGALADVLAPDRPELYFGEGLEDWYAIVGTRRRESGGTRFDATTGIPLDGLGRRAVLSLAEGAIEPLTSAELTADSQLLYRRGLRERLHALAPWLTFDHDPYPVVADGRVTWVVDAYTTSTTYPYAQFDRNVGLPGGAGLDNGRANYVKASIKATVDAYDGTVHLYRTEVGGADDPVLDAWTQVFPGLVEPIAEMPGTIREHLLYPQDLLVVQTAMLGRYHVTDAETLFDGTDSWAVSAAASDGVRRAGGEASDDDRGPADPVSLFRPGGGELGGHWVAVRPYGPGAADKPTSTRDEMVAIALADHDDPERLRLVRFETAPGRPVSSPQVAQAAIDTDRDLAQLFTLLNANGSRVEFGPMTPLPLDGAMVWARPLVVSGTSGTTTPRLYGVAAVSNGLVGVDGGVTDAVGAATQSSSPSPSS